MCEFPDRTERKGVGGGESLKRRIRFLKKRKIQTLCSLGVNEVM